MGVHRQLVLIVPPSALLAALEEVEAGTPAIEVMQVILDIAHSTEVDKEDE